MNVYKCVLMCVLILCVSAQQGLVRVSSINCELYDLVCSQHKRVQGTVYYKDGLTSESVVSECHMGVCVCVRACVCACMCVWEYVYVCICTCDVNDASQI